MKALLVLAFFSLAAVACAQTQPATPASGSQANLTSQPAAHLDGAGPAVRTCAYIHSFVFERHDGEAPRLTKETYCTPTGQFAVKRAFKPGLYPAVMAPQKVEPKDDPRQPL